LEPTDDEPDDEPDRLRSIVAREVWRRIKDEASARTAASLAAREVEARSEVAQAIVDQGLSTGDLVEFVNLKDDFSWTRPLSRASVIAYLGTLLNPQVEDVQPRQQPRQQQQMQQQPNPQPSDGIDQPATEHVDPQPDEHQPESAPSPEQFDLAPAEHFGIASDQSQCSESAASESDDEQWWGGRLSRPG
jgi:hypothetical protein